MKFGIALLGLVATVASAIPAGNTTRLEKKADCTPATLEWYGTNGGWTPFENWFTLTIRGKYTGKLTTYPGNTKNICSDDNKFCVSHGNGLKDQSLQLRVNSVRYKFTNQATGTINGDHETFLYQYWECIHD
ncbi:hypothetical protein BGW39_007633 [Mortierella sp. 14UC]|nr:hypothetical protein BGW39_007633 [Mortierella sp. 14UC]